MISFSYYGYVLSVITFLTHTFSFSKVFEPLLCARNCPGTWSNHVNRTHGISVLALKRQTVNK